MFRTTTARLIRYTGHTVPELVEPAYGATIRAAGVSLEARVRFLFSPLSSHQTTHKAPPVSIPSRRPHPVSRDNQIVVIVLAPLIDPILRGSRAHRSTTDPSDPQEVIAVRYYTARGLRLLSIHAHDDGTWKEFLSRPGRRLLDRLELVKGKTQGESRADEDTELP